MVIPFPKRPVPRADAERRPRGLEPSRRPLTPREISHRERMLSHLARLEVARRAMA
jgi:hypothetical protein